MKIKIENGKWKLNNGALRYKDMIERTTQPFCTRPDPQCAYHHRWDVKWGVLSVPQEPWVSCMMRKGKNMR